MNLKYLLTYGDKNNMNNENNQALSASSQSGFSPAQLDALKRLINPKGMIPDEQMMVFLHMCAKTKLDPFAKQIFAIPRGGQLTIQTSIDGFRLIAERTGRYAPGRATEFVFDDKGILVSATAFVKKMTDDGTWHEISETAYLKEYTNGGTFWARMPTVMLGKCAESRALRRAFPLDLSGLYTAEEIRDEKEEVLDILSEEQIKNLYLAVNGDLDLKKRLLTWAQAKDLESIHPAKYETIMNTIALEKKRQKGGTNGQ